MSINYNAEYYNALDALFRKKINEYENTHMIINEYIIVKEELDNIHYFLVDNFACNYKIDEHIRLYYSGIEIYQICYDADINKISEKSKFIITIKSCGVYKDISERIKKFEKQLNLEIRKNNLPKAQWAYMSAHGLDYSEVSITLLNHLIPEMYPYIESIDNYIDEFVESKQSILILTGEPGLGKTSFIKYLLYRTGWTPIVSYDEEVCLRDSLYFSFVKNENADVLILEDADVFLKSREKSSNKTMSKILNVSDGLIDFKNKKFIFTANIENIRDIDSALIRPGRCFDVLKFRPLTKDEALIAAKAINTELSVEKEEYTLAEIYMKKSNKDNIKNIYGGFGFNA